MSKFLLLLGPSGVGKSTIIEELCQIDKRFIYISPYMTRPLREGEKNKVSISSAQMDEMWNCGQLLVINELYGIRYATPRAPIEEALACGSFPILDWPISRIEVMTRAFPDQLHVVYISPPSIEVLCQRLAKDGRDIDGCRLKNACEELGAFWSSQYVGFYELAIVSEETQMPKIVHTIYDSYTRSFH